MQTLPVRPIRTRNAKPFLEALESRILCSASFFKVPPHPRENRHRPHQVIAPSHIPLAQAPNPLTIPQVASRKTITPTLMNTTAAGASPAVVGRYVYYGATSLSGDVLAFDKSVLLPGATATAANVTSYTGGINELAIDVSSAAANYAASDFTFRVGQSGDPAAWASAPAPASVTAVAGAGKDGSTRIFLRWTAGTLENQWLQVTFTPAADTFYLGNLVADTGTFQVTPATEAAARANTTSLFAPAAVTNSYDFNRDGKVDAIDQLVARAAIGASLPVFTAPAIPVAAAVSYDWHSSTINGSLNLWAPNPSDFGSTFTVTDPTMLFGPDGIPQIEGVRQGPIADCYFLAAGASLAYSNPSRLQAMIKNDPGGGWAVTFSYYSSAVGQYVPLVIHTDDELSSSLQVVSNNEVWSLVLEKAYAAFRTWNGFTSLNTMDSIGWGYGGSALTALGDNNISTYIGAMPETFIYSMIQSDLAAGQPILFHTSASAPTMVQSHVYVITAISTDAQGQRWVTTYNPWGFYEVRNESDLLTNSVGTLVVGAT